MAASLALMARDKNSVTLNCQVLIYPMLAPPAHSQLKHFPDSPVGQHIFTRGSNDYCWSVNLPGSDLEEKTVAGLAPDVSGLPPAFLAVGALDLFIHDNLFYVSRLLDTGCEVESHVYPGAIHAFDRMVEAEVSQRYNRELVTFIKKYLG
jgi:triacylglycerol lipase